MSKNQQRPSDGEHTGIWREEELKLNSVSRGEGCSAIVNYEKGLRHDGGSNTFPRKIHITQDTHHIRDSYLP